MFEGSRSESHMERLVAAVERLADALEHVAFPTLVKSLGGTDGSQVGYVDDAAQADLESRQQAYWEATGRKLDPWEAPPSPVDEHGREWSSQFGNSESPEAGA